MRGSVLILLLVCIVGICSSCGHSGRPRHFSSRPSVHSQTQMRRSPVDNTEKKKSQGISNGKLTPTQIFKRCNSAVFMIITSDGEHRFQGSGFFINNKGLALSNYHVFEGTYVGMEVIKMITGETLKVKDVILKDKENDFILFEVDSNGQNFNYIEIASNVVSVGDEVYALGSPQGLENTFSSGIVSQRRSSSIIQISVPIDHGSSGGALLNTSGEVVGITSGGMDSSGANLNYAIDMNFIRKIMARNNCLP